MRLQPTYTDGVGLKRCDWCLHPALTTADAEIIRRNLATIIELAPASAIETLARTALGKLQGGEDADLWGV